MKMDEACDTTNYDSGSMRITAYLFQHCQNQQWQSLCSLRANKNS